MLTRAQHRVAAAVEPIPNVGEDDAEKTQLIPDRDNDDLERTQPIPNISDDELEKTQPLLENDLSNISRLVSQEISNARALYDASHGIDTDREEKIIQEPLSDEDCCTYICGICQQCLNDGEYNTIGCEGGCECWFHSDCVNLSANEFTSLTIKPWTQILFGSVQCRLCKQQPQSTIQRM